MSKTVIYLKLVNGTLEYRDNEGHHGKSITSHVKYGGKIIWKLDRHSRISEINSITVSGDDAILKEKPKKIDFDHWEAVGADKGEGKLAYSVQVDGCKECGEEVLTEGNGLRDPDLPFIKLP